MSNLEHEIPYHHDNDCVMQGCPGHTMTVGYQSTSDWYSFDDGFKTFGCDRNTLIAMLKGLALKSYRGEVESDLREGLGETLSNSNGSGEPQEPMS